METTTLAAYGEILISRIKEALKHEEVHLLYLDKQNKGKVPSQYLQEVGMTKRLLERWCADDKFRRALAENPSQACQDWGLNIDPEALGIRALWDSEAALENEPSLHVLRYKAFIYEKLTHRNEIRSNHPDSMEAYNRWRARQMKRCENELAYFISKSIVHAPFCIELSQGCSVGCWFCGISAPKLEDLFLYTEENQALYHGVLTVMREVYGAAAGKGFCYWATDPLDNPDYEQFLIDFEKVTGVFPQTTTALPLRNVERTKKLLKLSRKYSGNIDRFSLLSLKQLDKVFEYFTPEELLHVELVTQNRENYLHKSRSGRAVEKEEKRKKPPSEGDQLSDGTIACVSGFLINMVNKEVKLITPCKASKRWPLGYIVLETGYFDTVESFRTLILDMVDRHMANLPDENAPLKLYDYIEVLEKDGQVILKGNEINRTYQGSQVLKRVIACLKENSLSTKALCDKLWDEQIQVYDVVYTLHMLLEEGVVNLEPTVEKEALEPTLAI